MALFFFYIINQPKKNPNLSLMKMNHIHTFTIHRARGNKNFVPGPKCDDTMTSSSS